MIMLEVPDNLKSLEPALKELVSVAARQLDRSRGLGPAQYERFEDAVAESIRAVERGVHSAALAALDVNESTLFINGRAHSRVMRCETTFMAQAGPVVVERTLYRPSNERNAPVVDLIAMRVGAVAGVWLPSAARAMAHLLQQGTSREAEATSHQLGRLPYSRTSFETVGHAVGRRYVEQHQHVERLLIERFEVPADSHSVSVSLDRVAVPMEEPRALPAGRRAKGAPERPVSVVYRMAYAGTVTLHDAEGEAIYTIRYGTMPNGDPQTLCMGMADDVLQILSRRPELELALLCDGAAEMWNLLDVEFNVGAFGDRTIHRMLDFWHVIEKLAPAANQLFGGADAKRNLMRWKLALLNRSRAAAEILVELRASGKENIRVGDECPVHDAITYLDNNGHRLDYAAARRSSLPIGSGNVEATCKSLFGLRFKRPGARWKTATGEHIAHLRALALSDRWTDAMNITLACPRVTIRKAA